ncbi:N-acetyl-gamma-glutamyl-phosphate reductase [Arcticibacter sp.]|uniref:N-acetyl-gamma-glutamyl-phosphate reductase n=1 Tax=Arcticibacter sp. TaxID=1872630 RepID=UPI00388FD897
MQKIKAGIIGGAGYTGGELLRLLVNHPHVDIHFVHSNSNAGNLVSDVHTDLTGETSIAFTDTLSQDIDVLFLCVGHGDAKKFLDKNPVDPKVRVIDLSQDFRLEENADFRGGFVYGLPELQKEKIKTARNIANPGCFATCIQLALLPLAQSGNLNKEVHISATTGSTGAGQSLSPTSHFSWRNNNSSVYKPFAHQHLKEITQSLNQAGSLITRDDMNFIPYRGDFTRGIIASLYTESDLSLEQASELFSKYYEDHPFTHVLKKNIDLKQVVNTNKCFLYLEKHDNKLLIISIIDNLLKGASGQAVQNMNLLFGFDEQAGLRLKAAAF